MKNVIDNPRGEARPIDTYIAFRPEQIKKVDNLNPTSNPDIRRSLSNVGEQFAPTNHSDVFGKDIALEAAPVEDVAPVREETVAENATVEENLFPDDALAPLADDPARFDSLDDADVPPERVAEGLERER